MSLSPIDGQQVLLTQNRSHAPVLKCSGSHGCNHGDVMVQQQVTKSPVASWHPPVPHATFRVIVVEKVPQIDPLYFQSSLEDPGEENRKTVNFEATV